MSTAEAHPPFPPIRDRGSVDSSFLTQWLEGSTALVRARLRATLATPAFDRPPPESSLEDQREHVLARMLVLAAHGYGGTLSPLEFGGDDDPAATCATVETLAQHDLSLAVKWGAQTFLWGGALLRLGTAQQHCTWIPDTNTFARLGCFAMTEAGHGSNVRALETTATFDAETDSFVIDTPLPSAAKKFIGGAACHAHAAVVFAQLETRGERHGVHAFIVPLRDGHGNLLPGVDISDDGYKAGLNGVDNGSISFHTVRIPRTALLDRFGAVSAYGAYSSVFTNPSARFFAMLSALVFGRIVVSATALAAAKVALTIAVRYAARRRQFAPPGSSEESLLIDHPAHRARLLPLVAAAYAHDCALRELLRRHTDAAGGTDRDLETLIAAFKAVATWEVTHTIQTCREACGGEGYLRSNRLAELKADTDIFTTFEGDNTVLLLLAAKHLPVLAPSPIDNSYPTTNDTPDVASGAWQLHVLHTRSIKTRRALVDSLAASRAAGVDTHVAFAQQQHSALHAARCHIEHFVCEQFSRAIARCPDPAVRAVLKRLAAVHALDRITADSGWFAMNGFVDARLFRAIETEIFQIQVKLKDEAVRLVNAFAIPDTSIGAPIALGATNPSAVRGRN